MSGSVTFDSRSFIINGERQFLTSGTIHYFRVPRDLWADRLAKARAFGLNCVETYVAWNWHEQEEGRFDFSGERDFGHFLGLCRDMGLWVVMRPGPYICAEWDFGGFPCWLAQKRGLRLRHYDPVYLRYVDRYLDEVLPRIAPYQVTQGGTVFMVQAENELGNVARDDAAAYMAHLVAGFRRRGIEVVINTCAGAAEGTIECINSGDPARQIPEFRRRQPEAPLFSTEFWPGWYALWDSQDRRRPPYTERYEAATWRFIALGASGYNYYMWHGGTNFGYTTMYLQTTSYDYTAPLTEAGGLAGDKWHRLRRPALFARALAAELAAAGDGREVPASAAAVHYLRPLEQGEVHFLHNPGRNAVEMQVGDDDLALAPRSWRTVVAEVPLSARLTLARCTTGVLFREYIGGLPSLVVYGPGTVVFRGQGAFKAQGNLPVMLTARAAVIEADQGRLPAAVTLSCGGERWRVVWVSEQDADRTWLADGKLYVGPHLVTAGGERVTAYFDRAPAACRVIGEQEEVRSLEISSALPAPPALEEWQTAVPECPEYAPERQDGEWVGMMRPINKLLLGDGGGYAWYRAEVHLDADWAYPMPLHFTALADRALVFWNGRLVGTSEAPDTEDRKVYPSFTVTVRPRRGRNVVAVLTDNLGLGKGDWQVPVTRVHEEDQRGLFGPVYLALQREITHWRFQAGLDGERLGWHSGKGDRWQPAGKAKPAPASWHRATFRLTAGMLGVPQPLRWIPEGLSKGVLWVNGHHLGRYWARHGQDGWYVPECWLCETNTLVLFEETPAQPLRSRLAWDETAVPGRVQM